MLEHPCAETDRFLDNHALFCLPNDHWTNEDNKDFYEKLSIEEFKLFAKRGGLDSCCDLELLKPHWSKANSILEVGAGYGRVIDYLIENGFSGEITGIERCHSYFEYLEEKYVKNSNVSLINDDIYDYDFNEKFDLILFLWSGLSDFAEQEQFFIFKKLASLLNKGKLIIETLSPDFVPFEAIKFTQRNYSYFGNYTYMPEAKELKLYAKNAGISDVSHKAFKSCSGYERLLYMLS